MLELTSGGLPVVLIATHLHRMTTLPSRMTTPNDTRNHLGDPAYQVPPQVFVFASSLGTDQSGDGWFVAQSKYGARPERVVGLTMASYALPASHFGCALSVRELRRHIGVLIAFALAFPQSQFRFSVKLGAQVLKELNRFALPSNFTAHEYASDLQLLASQARK